MFSKLPFHLNDIHTFIFTCNRPKKKNANALRPKCIERDYSFFLVFNFYYIHNEKNIEIEKILILQIYAFCDALNTISLILKNVRSSGSKHEKNLVATLAQKLMDKMSRNLIFCLRFNLY